MKNREIARVFSEMADILEFKGYDVFKIRAYRRASLNLEGFSKGIDDLSHKELLEIPGIGQELAAKIEEYLRSGSISVHEKLKKEVPPGMLALLAIPGLGPKTARVLYDRLGVTTIDELEQAASEHRLTGIPKIREKTEENILRGIAMVKRGRERLPLGRVLPVGLEVVEELRKRVEVERMRLPGASGAGKRPPRISTLLPLLPTHLRSWRHLWPFRR